MLHPRLRRAVVAATGVTAVIGAAAGFVPTPAPAAQLPVRSPFIVTLDPSVADPAAVATEQVLSAGGTLGHVYRHALKGYSATLPTSAVRQLLADPRVDTIEPDGVMRAVATQSGATWGLDRVDQRALPLNGTYGYTRTGAGVTAYIIDTGIRTTHADFGGRAVAGYDAVTAGGKANDCNGHGTHVAGTTGGATWGVAKGVRLVAVRVLDCGGSGATSGVIAGVDWVTGNHAAGTPAVANMSLGGGANSALDTAVRSSIADGITYSVAAGNGLPYIGIAENACNVSPARVAEAITIGATTRTDAKASYSNYGSCVDWFAPGSSITSAWYTNDTATNTISGTSMAAPHNAGASALYLEGNPGASPAAVRQALFDLTTKGVVTSSSTANNHLLFTSP